MFNGGSGKHSKERLNKVKELWISLKGSHWVIKSAVAFGLVVILGNLLFMVYANGFLLHDRSVSGSTTAGPNRQRGTMPLDAAGYENMFLKHYNTWIVELERIKYLTEANVPHDGNWKNQFAIEVTQIKLLAGNAHQINPPVEHEVAHQKYLMAVDDFSWAADNLVKALTENDRNLTKRCNKKIEQGTSHLKHALDLIDQGL